MAGEKTEKATPKKRREAREEGQVLKSNELNTVALIIAGYAIFVAYMPIVSERIKAIMIYYFSGEPINLEQAFTTEFVHKLLIEGIYEIFIICLPIYLMIMITALTVNYLQIGFLFSAKALNFKMSRLDPIKGFSKLFSIKSFVEMLKATFKIALIGIVLYFAIKDEFNSIPKLINVNIDEGLGFIKETTKSIIIKTIILLSILAVFDYIYQWWEYEKGLKMTKQEIKDEYKLVEGDPKIKQRIRDVQRRMAMRRMMQEVPKADVVITNPYHISVALKYDKEKGDAPMLVAKGKELIAKKIKEIAKENNVGIVENKYVARQIFHNVNLGESIPEELFEAVAKILAYVYSLKRK